MKLIVLRRIGIGLVAAALSGAASAQMFTNQKYWDVQHRIILPPSSQAQPFGHLHTDYLVVNGALMPKVSAAAFPPGFHPNQVRAAYSMPDNGGTGAVAIIDAFHDTTALADFNTYAQQFGLPTETSSNATASTNKVFQVVYAKGTQPVADQGWAGEETLDIEWVHSIAPNAKIYLVEAATNGNTDLFPAAQFAASLPGVKEVSMSFGEGESPGETANDFYFDNPGVVSFASSGDTGGVQEYPSEAPTVVGVGGTSLFMSGNFVTAETAWNGSGGGPSSVEPLPAFQKKIGGIIGAHRGTPDLSGIADPNTGVACFSTFAFGGWAVIGGTSLACPVNAAMANVRKSYSTNTLAEHNRIYGTLAGTTSFRDVTQGTAGSFSAKTGWDFITGWGSPVGLFSAPVTFSPTSIQVMYGTYANGNSTSLQAQDGSFYVVNSALLPSYGPAAAELVDSKAVPLAGKTIQTAVATAIASSTSASSTLQLFAYNWTSKAYVLVKSISAGAGSQTLSATLVDPGYWTGGDIRLAVRALIPSTYGVKTLTLSVDQVQIVADEE